MGRAGAQARAAAEEEAAMRWLVVLVAGLEAGFMLFDGARALIVGDYLTPSSGEYAGRLGPWARLVGRVGIDPRSAGMKWLFVVYGLVWLGVLVAFALGWRWAWWATAALAAGSLWYLVPGTVLSAVTLVLLVLPGMRLD